MLEQLRRLSRDSAVYGIGHIATRLLTFLLLPYYSYRLSPSEYGELTLYFIFVAVAQTFFIYGLDIAYLRYFTLSKEQSERRHVTGTAISVSVITTLALTAAVILLSNPISAWIVSHPTNPGQVSLLIRLCAGILFFDTLATFPFLLLRATLRPYHFAAVKLLNVIVNVGLNIWFVGSLELAIFGVLLANLIASALTLVVLLPTFLPHVQWGMDRALLGDMVRFGLPNIPTYLFVMVIELADRKILEMYRGLEEAGLYSAGYKLGMFMAVVTGAFRFAWQPFFLSHADREDAPRLFARVLTYFLLITGALLLVLAFFVEGIVKTPWPGVGRLLAPAYWPGLAVFPIIMLAHVFDGVYANLMVGVYLKKLTAWLPLVTGIAAAVTIGLNLLLIPRFGMMAAAWITLLAFFLEAAGLWLVVRRAYAVPYEWRRIAILFAVFGAVYALGMSSILSFPFAKLILLLLVPFALYVASFFDEREKYHLRKIFSRG